MDSDLPAVKLEKAAFEGVMEEVKQGGIAAFSVKNPYLMIVICIITVLMGALAIAKMPKDLLPASKQPAVQILSLYPGMATPNIETNLTYKFERYTGQAAGVVRQESRSIPGVSIVKNFFDENSSSQSQAMASTTALILSVMRRLPPGAQPPIVLPFDPMGSVPLTLVAVGGDFEPSKAYDYAQYYVRREIQSNPGAIAPTQMGGAEKQVIVRLDPSKLKTYNFSPLEIINKLSHQNTFIPAGDVKIGNLDYQVYANGIADTVESLNHFSLRASEGVNVYLKDVGKAEESSIIQTNIVTVDGVEQVYVPVFRQLGANSIEVVEKVRESMKELGNSIQGLKLTLVADQTVFIRHAIESIGEEAIVGGGLAALMVFLFLGNPRATFATLLSLPLSTFFVFMGLNLLGQSINIMTLGGMALSIGLLVDNSIVAIENIMRHLKEDENPDHIAVIINGAHEVTMPIIAVTLCNVVVLLPLLMTSGVINVLFGAVAKTVMLAITGSLVSETAVIPLFASRFLSGEIPKLPRFFERIQNSVLRLSGLYGRLLEKVFRRIKLILVCMLVLTVLGLFLSRFIGTELFPRADAGFMVVEVRFESGLRIEETAKRIKNLEKRIREIIPADDLKMIISDIGVYNGYPAAFTGNAGTGDATLTVELTDHRKYSSQHYASVLRREIPKVYPEAELGIQLGGMLTSALNGGAKAPIDIQVEGKNAEESYRTAQELLPEIKKMRGAVDVRIQERFDAPVINVDIDRVKSDELGIYTDEVVENVVSSLSGSITFKPTIWVDPKTGLDYFMGVRMPEKEIQTMSHFRNLPVSGHRQERILKLDQVSKISEGKGISELNRVNMKRVINIFLDAEGRDVGSLSSEIQKLIDSKKFPSGIKVELRGEIGTMKDSVRQLSIGFILSIVLVYLILVTQFRSFVLPLIMMMTVPLGIVGIIIMFVATGTYYSLQAGIGTVFLVGIAVSNGVLLLEFILHKIEHEKLPLDTAIIEGAKARLRPIMMTSLASMLGLVPMAVGFGKGSEANIPLGRAVIGGQLLSTLLTLFFLPAVFRFVHSKFLSKSEAV